MKNNNTYIMNCGYERTNYGAVLTAFALQKTLSDIFNINCKNIDISPSLKKALGIKNIGFNSFKNKYMNFTNPIRSLEELIKLNDDAQMYITGSDQVFRIPFVNGIKNGYEQFFLDFADINVKKIAVSASFGITKEKFLEEVDAYTIEKMKHSLSTYDYISVREKSGVDICRDIFKIDAKCIIDPVFWVSKSEYENIASESKNDYSQKIVSYFFNKGRDFSNEFHKISKKYNSEIVELSQSDKPIEEWLNAIRTCKLFITNSFHGMCFAIIFNKPFICMINSYSGNARNSSVLELLQINDNLITNFEDIYKRDCVFQYDTNLVNKNIEKEREEAIIFLKEAIQSEHKVTTDKLKHSLWLAKNKILEMEKELTLKNLLKCFIWEKWLKIYHYYLPQCLKYVISKIYMNLIVKEK